MPRCTTSTSRGAAPPQNPEEHYRYAYGLTQFSDPALVRKTMDYIARARGAQPGRQAARCRRSSRILMRDSCRGRSFAIAGPRCRRRSGDLVFGGNGVVIAALGTFCDSRTRQDVAKFFAAHKVPDAARTLQQTLERIDECSALTATQPATLTAWLAAHRRGATDRTSGQGRTSMTSHMRRTVLPLVVIGLAIVPAAAQRARQPGSSRAAPASSVRDRSGSHGPKADGVHRLLSVRLRRLDGQPSAPGRSVALRQVRRAAGAQQRRPSRHPREPRQPRRRDPDATKIGDYYGSCMDEAAIAAKGTAPLKEDCRSDCGARRPCRPAAARRPTCTARASAFFSASVRRPTSRTPRRSSRHRPGRAGAAGPRLLRERRRRMRRSCAPSTPRMSAACCGWPGMRRPTADEGRRRSCESRRRWRRRRSIASAAAPRRTCTTRCRSTKSRR